MAEIDQKILIHLNENGLIDDSYPWSKELGYGHDDVVGRAKSLSVIRYVVTENLSTSFYTLTDQGSSVIKDGSQEMKVFNAIKEASKLSMNDLKTAVGKDTSKIGMAQCMKNKWIKKEGDDLIPIVESVEDIVRSQLQSLDNMSDKIAKELKKRKLISLKKISSLKIEKGPSFSLEIKKQAADITKEMLDSGEWKDIQFKPYTFLTFGQSVGGGYLHPLLKVRAEFRKVLMQMGFEEMPTNKWVESSFWNFDSLFQPQSHPARDAHDTFFIKEPARTVSVPEEYYERVKTMHEKGGSGSIGYRYDFQREEAFKNLLRTHTTAISSQMLYKLAQNCGDNFKPAKYFSIDRVFRNETMDATHLCEFHQVEGMVVDYNLSLGDLIGTVETFFKKIGITQLRFKPAFNPYTEPSMEVFGYHPTLEKWTEIGNSGMFRPEMLAPMGLPEGVRVIAWGLSLERPTMIKYKIDNIRDLFGHKVEMARTKTAPVCRF